MNALNTARSGYASAAAPVRTPRGTEYEVFARVTRELKATAEQKTRNFPAFAEALNRNRQLWTILAADVADPDNALPPPLRARLFYLAEFTGQHTSKILTGDADPAILVEINSTIMQGLRGTGGV